ncbi:hypothetical protein B0H11DRAFT_2279996 [Mycena galericulata]|nr:hypothetical protein B0H11DRAFT_2135536 [Mycena galericulata]KAJ7482991.1 hypothetical protein B0H11DRAFT_2279996 [Mycena galericulata]
MQFTLISLIAVLATGVAAAPAAFRRQTCDVATCLLDLAPTGVSCASAAAQVDIDPISDISCIIAAAKDVTALPASCSGCIPSSLSSIGSDIKGIF